MMKRDSSLVYIILQTSFLTVLLYSYPGLTAAATQEQWVARAVSVQGAVEAQRVGDAQWQPVRLHDTFRPGDRIRVLESSRADVALLDQSVLRLSANTTITIEAIKEERTAVVDLLRGAAHFFSRGPRSLEVQTPYTIAGVRGTEFFISVEPERTLLSIFEGTVLAANSAGNLTLTSGQSASAEAGTAPVLRVVARPRDAIQWALYYPPVLYFPPEALAAGADWQGMVRQSMQFYLRGDLQRAFKSIANVPPEIRDPRFFAYRAHLFLAVGQIDEAKANIEQALRLNPNDSHALALQTIIAVVQNERDQALRTAQQAVAAAPNSATALIALSYAQQARFDLEGARTSLEQAVRLEPNNALAWARLAELQSSFGALQKALQAGQRAVDLEPNLARTQTVLGYAYLTQVKTTQAKAAFDKAIALDQADALPRLGLGLATIREGQLDAGRRDIEIAASLDPNNALIRSYLGKAYFEEKRTGLDEREYGVAKQLDPQDPTPWFYDAIAKQTTNRPVEALHDLQRSIELNDNRAVYRSRLLLDSDLAARSASLGRIYSDLGFQQLALVEGWKSVNTDPSNFSAHRFLADSYAVLPRHEIARVSELLQSQLLQPINITPIQPRLAESNLLLSSGQGPGATSFNEFNPLFNRNGVAVQATGLGGTNGTWGGEGVFSGLADKTSFSLGYNYFTTNGFRRNSDQEDNLVDAFVQQELTPNASIQAEYRYRNNKTGDLQQRFFPEDFFPGLTSEEERTTYRLGGRYAFGPNSTVLGSFMYSHAQPQQRDNEPPLPIPFLSFVEFSNPPIDAFSGEIQHLFRSRYINLVSGVGYFNISGVISTTLGIDPPGPFFLEIPTETDIGLHHVNGYLYSYANVIKNVTLTAGFSVDALGGDSGFIPGGSTDQVNPKIGVTWNPFPTTTVRAAAFRIFKRTLITDQTLEPTQVAGFNQFFDDVNATDAWRYGAAIDQKFTRDLFGGVEFSYRDLTIPQVVVTNGTSTTIELDGNEYLGRSYLFWTPHPWLALRAQYIYERFENDAVVNQPFELTTQRIPLGLNVFHPSGFGASLIGTYWHQYGEFQRVAKEVFGVRQSGSDHFSTIDAGINYRLPKRNGFVTVGATNLFDDKFKFFNTDIKNSYLQPTRMVFGRITLAFP